MISRVESDTQKYEFQAFITHVDHKLVHKWFFDNTLHSQFVIDDVRSQVSVIKKEELYNIFYIDTKGNLICLRRHYEEDQQEWFNEQTVIEQNLSFECHPIVIKNQVSYHLFFLDNHNRFIQICLSQQQLNIKYRRTLKDSLAIKTDLKLVKITPSFYFIFLLDNKSLTFCLFNQDSTQNPQWKETVHDCLSIQNADPKDQSQVIVFYKNDQWNLCKLILQIKSFSVKSNKKFDLQLCKDISSSNFSCIYEKSNLELYFVEDTKKICLFNEKTSQKHVVYEESQPIKSIITFKLHHILHIIYINRQETLVYLKQQNQKMHMHQQKKSLVWEEIQSKFQPIGDQGYHANAFYSKELGLVAKRMRNPNSLLINNEIRNLDYLSQYLNIQCLHRIIKNRAIAGFTMHLIIGQKWDQILAKNSNIFASSSIARVLFAQKLTQIIRILQTNMFCHGDFHLSNVLINIKNEDILYPQFQIQLIDFGNGYIFREGELVSKGMTGLQIIVPFEAESLRKKNYNPIGINAYQLGRNILQILLLSKHSDVGKLQYFANKELNELKTKTQYPPQVYDFVSGLVHQDPNQRNIWLFRNIDHLVQKTRSIYLTSS